MIKASFKGTSTKRPLSFAPFSVVSCALLLIFAASSLKAQSQDATDVVEFIEGRNSYEGNRVRQGSTFKIAVRFDLVSRNNPFINSAQPFDPTLIPTKLELVNLDKLDGLTFDPPDYPKGTRIKRRFSKEPLSAYWGYTRIQIDGRVAPNMLIGRYEIKAKLTYQPCYESGCGTPMSRSVIIPIEVVDPKAKVQWDEYYFRRVTTRDYLLVPWRLVTGIGKCAIKGCS